MTKVYKVSMLVVVFLTITLLNIAQLMSPRTAHAKVIVMAGIKSGVDCNCPVLIGDCSCKITLPDPPKN